MVIWTKSLLAYLCTYLPPNDFTTESLHLRRTGKLDFLWVGTSVYNSAGQHSQGPRLQQSGTGRESETMNSQVWLFIPVSRCPTGVPAWFRGKQGIHMQATWPVVHLTSSERPIRSTSGTNTCVFMLEVICGRWSRVTGL